MSVELVCLHGHHYHIATRSSSLFSTRDGNFSAHVRTRLWMDNPKMSTVKSSHKRVIATQLRPSGHRNSSSLTVAAAAGGVPPPPLDLTEDNIRQVLADARVELGQIFDDSVGITGQVELAELDGPFVKISLKGRFWHKRSTVVARVGNYLMQRIPDILEVDIEDEKQLDDSPASF